MLSRFTILNVGHGNCAYLVAENGNVMLFDCGHNSDPEFRPSKHFKDIGITNVEWMFISNYDEDHLSDFPNIFPIGVSVFSRNPTISPEQLEKIKKQSGPLSTAMESFISMIKTSTPFRNNLPTFPGIEWTTYYNSYPSDFEDTNNLSLVTFLKFKGNKIVLPGDLEKPGWEKLLSNENFRQELKDVNVFVASHHGRESGYCEKVFSYCNPSMIVVSDGQKEFATQEMVDTYARHASGVHFNGETRKVLTTRKDGTLTWNFGQN